MQNIFPVDAVLPTLAEALAAPGRAILIAPPGSGKTTRVPLALAGLLNLAGYPSIAGNMRNLPGYQPLPGKVLVLEPRRLAARSAAAFMARQLGEAVGQSVGYRVRLEQKVSPATRVELLTEGMLTRRLMADPELSGVSCVIFDEFHERSLQADLGLALCLEAAEALRPDLRLLVMSATLEVEPLRRLLGNCPVIQAEGRQWPVSVRHADPGDCPNSARPSSRELAAKTAKAVLGALREESGSILVFLPGAAEIRQTTEILAEFLTENSGARTKDLAGEAISLHPLYGDLPTEAQDAAIAAPPPGTRKVVLSTNIAQTSLTIEGVCVVIDSGLTRLSRFDPATGMSGLVTARVSLDDAEQRAGRAGRLEPGICVRLWPQGEVLPPHGRPEILDADLTSLLLDVLAWGAAPASLNWLTAPPQAALDLAEQTLLNIGAATGTGQLRITPHGEALARLPLHPRLAHMVLVAADNNKLPPLPELAASLAAIIAERDPLRTSGAQAEFGRPGQSEQPGQFSRFGQAEQTSADIRLRLLLLREDKNHRLRLAAEQIFQITGKQEAKSKNRASFRLPIADEEDFSGALLSLAWPERIAMRRSTGSFLLASGQGAQLPEGDPLAASHWLAVAVVSAPTGGGGSEKSTQRIRLAAPLSLEDILHLHGQRLLKQSEVKWDSRNKAVLCREVTKLDALILEETKLTTGELPDLAVKVKQEMLKGILELGSGCLPWTIELRQWQARVLLLRGLDELTNSDWPDVSDAALFASIAASLNNQDTNTQSSQLEDWLSPWLDEVSKAQQLETINLKAALTALLPYELIKRLEQEAPKSLVVPSGSQINIDYIPALNADGGLSGARPVLAVKLQEMFGLAQTPTIAGGRCLLSIQLLSPAGRPLQITSDLAYFWSNSYAQVRAEMRGRYPKHSWPEDPLNAVPTRKSKAALDREAKRSKKP